MRKRDLDRNMTDDRMRNREDMGSHMPDESQDDLQRKQIEGNLGNERVRGKSRSNRDDMRGMGE